MPKPDYNVDELKPTELQGFTFSTLDNKQER
jgi:hypothetical protein